MIIDSLNTGVSVQALIVVAGILLGAVTAVFIVMRRSKKYRLAFDILDSVNHAMLAASPDWKITIYANTACDNLCGSGANLRSNPLGWLDYINENDRPAIEELVRAPLKPGEVRKLPDFKIKLSEGTVKWISADLRLTDSAETGNSMVTITASDITQWKGVENSYNSIMNNLQDVYYRSDLSGRLVMIGSGIKNVLGYDNPDECIGMNIAEKLYTNPEDRETLINILKEKGQVTDYETVLKRKDGSPVYVSTNSHFYYNDDGSLGGVEGLVRDITERKKAEEMFNMAFHNNPSPMAITCVETGLAIEVNNAWLDSMGYERGEVIGRTVAELNVYKNPGDRKRIVDLLMQTGRLNGVEIDFLTKTGRIKNGIFFGERIQVAGRDMILASMLDITERRRAEEAISNEQLFSKSLIDSLPGIFYLYTYPELKLVRWNRNHETLLGYEQGEIAGRNMSQWFSADQTDAVNRAVDIVMSEGINTLEAALLTKSGDHVPFLLTGIRFIMDGNKYLMGVGVDITESKRKDEQLRQAQKLETVGTLAGGLAHDFNNILSGISSTVSLIKHMMERDRLVNDRFGKYIDLIDRSGKRAVDLIQQLLALSKRYESVKKPVNLKRAVSDVIQICSNTFDKSIRIVTEFPGAEPYVSGDISQIEQVVLNLCVNASHAMTIMRSADERRGGTLAVSVNGVNADRHFCSIHPDAHPGKYWLVSLSDTGVGIDRDIIGSIFDPFFSTKAKGEGTGLGLTMVHNIVSQHGGFIAVYSEVGTGSTFNVYLPEMDHESAGEEESADGRVVHGSGEILVIDDEEIVRFMAESILTECGYSVVTAAGGAEGLELFRQKNGSIDAVLLDMAMPGMSGREVYIEMKKIRPDVRVLLASGFRLDTRVDEALALGVNGFIQKPYSITDLSRKLDDILRTN